jgi:hypothetical protein
LEQVFQALVQEMQLVESAEAESGHIFQQGHCQEQQILEEVRVGLVTAQIHLELMEVQV